MGAQPGVRWARGSSRLLPGVRAVFPEKGAKKALW